jgi:hypothetical protein
MSTNAGSLTPYCTVQQLTFRYDVRTIADFASDAGVRINVNNLTNNATILELLGQASGMVEAACLKGDIYSATDLQNLTGNSSKLLAGIVADLTIWLLWNRRQNRERALPPQVDVSIKALEQIEIGKKVFAIQENMDAGILPNPQFMTERDLTVRNYSSNQAGRFFGRRAQHQVPGPTGSGGCDGCT